MANDYLLLAPDMTPMILIDQKLSDKCATQRYVL